jgi:hypothetical protein
VIRRGRRSLICGLAAMMAVFGCTSPEAERTRGGARGADVGNHPAGPVEIHAGAGIYKGTPTSGSGIGRHADIGGAVEAPAR